jgi:hypothetical protein
MALLRLWSAVEPFDEMDAVNLCVVECDQRDGLFRSRCYCQNLRPNYPMLGQVRRVPLTL